MDNRLRSFAIAAVVAVFLSLAACGGGRAVVNTSAQTCGKELQDLQEAHAKGTLNDREYERLRKATVERCRRRR